MYTEVWTEPASRRMRYRTSGTLRTQTRRQERAVRIDMVSSSREVIDQRVRVFCFIEAM